MDSQERRREVEQQIGKNYLISSMKQRLLILALDISLEDYGLYSRNNESTNQIGWNRNVQYHSERSDSIVFP